MSVFTSNTRLYLPVTLAFDGCYVTAATTGAKMSVHPASRCLLVDAGVAELRLEQIEGSEVFPTDGALDVLLAQALLMFRPDLHAPDVNTVTTAEPEEEKIIKLHIRRSKINKCIMIFKNVRLH